MVRPTDKFTISINGVELERIVMSVRTFNIAEGEVPMTEIVFQSGESVTVETSVLDPYEHD